MAAQKAAATDKDTRLSKHRIVEVAVAFADEHGLDGLSMRKLAKELGTGAMSLYNHVANKDELLTAMIDVVFAEMDAPASAATASDPADWRAAMRASAISSKQAYTKHPWAVAASMSYLPGPIRLRHMEVVLAAFSNSGLDRDPAHHAYHAYEIHISGFMLSQLAFRYDEDELKDAARSFAQQIDKQEFPHLVDHVHEHLEDRGSDFDFGLDLLLDGFERLRATSS